MTVSSATAPPSSNRSVPTGAPAPRGRVTALLSEATDERLMTLVAGHDAEAFGAIYDRHSGPAFSLALRIMRARGPAEDVTQEAFLSLWRGAGRYRAGRGSVKTFLLGIVHHRAIDALRREAVVGRRRASSEGLEDLLPAREQTDSEAARREEARAVQAALGALPERQSRVLELAFFGGLTHTQIAAMLEEPLGTVKGRIRLGLDRLREELAPAGFA